MFQFADTLHVLLSFLPPWFELCLMLIFGIMMVILLLKVIAFVMDALPFI